MKRFFSLLLIVIAVCAVAHAKVIKGKCGDNVRYALDTETGVLSISGTGNMKDFNLGKSSWYSNCKLIKKVIIEEGVNSIGKCAFEGCSNLSSIIIPESVTTIGFMSLIGCESLTEIYIPKSVTSIDDHVFDRCSKLARITIDSENSIFYSIDDILYERNGKENLYKGNILRKCPQTIQGKIALSKGFTSIDNYAFAECQNLTSVIIPEGVTSIGSYAFEDCSNLTSVSIPNSVRDLGIEVFNFCM